MPNVSRLFGLKTRSKAFLFFFPLLLVLIVFVLACAQGGELIVYTRDFYWLSLNRENHFNAALTRMARKYHYTMRVLVTEGGTEALAARMAEPVSKPLMVVLDPFTGADAASLAKNYPGVNFIVLEGYPQLAAHNLVYAVSDDSEAYRKAGLMLGRLFAKWYLLAEGKTDLSSPAFKAVEKPVNTLIRSLFYLVKAKGQVADLKIKAGIVWLGVSESLNNTIGGFREGFGRGFGRPADEVLLERQLDPKTNRAVLKTSIAELKDQGTLFYLFKLFDFTGGAIDALQDFDAVVLTDAVNLKSLYPKLIFLSLERDLLTPLDMALAYYTTPGRTPSSAGPQVFVGKSTLTFPWESQGH